MSAPTILAAGPDDTDRSGGGTNPGWVAARDRAIREAADAAAATHRATLRAKRRESVAACRALVNALLCERCDRSVPAGDCTCRARRSNRKAKR